jgi:hypothetical protein
MRKRVPSSPHHRRGSRRALDAESLRNKLANNQVDRVIAQDRLGATQDYVRRGRHLEHLNRDALKQIELTSPIVWTIRGAPTRVQRMKRHPKGIPASWTSGPVRDQLVSITDALRFAGSLRSSATTHKFVKESRSITVYDAHNLQHLARRLIMERLGYWPITD